VGVAMEVSIGCSFEPHLMLFLYIQPSLFLKQLSDALQTDSEKRT
jgi:hypothetical protein